MKANKKANTLVRQVVDAGVNDLTDRAPQGSFAVPEAPEEGRTDATSASTADLQHLSDFSYPRLITPQLQYCKITVYGTVVSGKLEYKF